MLLYTLSAISLLYMPYVLLIKQKKNITPYLTEVEIVRPHFGGFYTYEKIPFSKSNEVYFSDQSENKELFEYYHKHEGHEYDITFNDWQEDCNTDNQVILVYSDKKDKIQFWFIDKEDFLMKKSSRQ